MAQNQMISSQLNSEIRTFYGNNRTLRTMLGWCANYGIRSEQIHTGKW